MENQVPAPPNPPVHRDTKLVIATAKTRLQAWRLYVTAGMFVLGMAAVGFGVYLSNQRQEIRSSANVTNNCCSDSHWLSTAGGGDCGKNDGWNRGFYACERGECNACRGGSSGTCNFNGRCDPGEHAGNCPSDCTNQGTAPTPKPPSPSGSQPPSSGGGSTMPAGTYRTLTACNAAKGSATCLYCGDCGGFYILSNANKTCQGFARDVCGVVIVGTTDPNALYCYKSDGSPIYNANFEIQKCLSEGARCLVRDTKGNDVVGTCSKVDATVGTADNGTFCAMYYCPGKTTTAGGCQEGEKLITCPTTGTPGSAQWFQNCNFPSSYCGVIQCDVNGYFQSRVYTNGCSTAQAPTGGTQPPPPTPGPTPPPATPNPTPPPPSSPPTPTPPPTAEPTFSCLRIDSSLATPALGDTVSFTCTAGGTISLVDSYEFRYRVDSEPYQTIGLSSTRDNQSLGIRVTKPGVYQVGCRACSGANCTAWVEL